MAMTALCFLTACEVDTKRETPTVRDQKSKVVDNDKISHTKSSVEVASQFMIPEEESILVFAYLKNASGNLLKLSDKSVTFSLTGTGTSLGTFGMASWDADHKRYVATFTASRAGTPISVLAVYDDQGETAPISTSLPSLQVRPAIGPVATMELAAPREASRSFVVRVNFSRPVVGLAASDFIVGNVNGLALSGSGASYELEITPKLSTSMNVSLPAISAMDEYGLGNLPVQIAAPGSPAQALHNFLVSTAAQSVGAGTLFSVSVSARDSNNNVKSDYLGTIAFSSSDVTDPVLPSNYTFQAGDGGEKQFSVILKTAGNQTISVYQVAGGQPSGTSGPIAVSGGAATKLIFIDEPQSTIAGGALGSMRIRALDAYNNTSSSFNSVIALSIASNSGDATLLGTTSSSAVSGTASFSNNVIIKAGASYTLMATALGVQSATSMAFSISAAAFHHLSLESVPQSALLGTLFQMRVWARDAFDNVLSNYSGDLVFSSDDASAILPHSPQTFSGGSGSMIFNFALNTIGTQLITVQSATGSVVAAIDVYSNPSILVQNDSLYVSAESSSQSKPISYELLGTARHPNRGQCFLSHVSGNVSEVGCDCDGNGSCWIDFSVGDYPSGSVGQIDIYLSNGYETSNTVSIRVGIDDNRIYGCTDPGAINFISAANSDNGSCNYNGGTGCMDSNADNYNSNAVFDDGGCTYTTYGCTDPNALNYNSGASSDDGSCTYGWNGVPLESYELNPNCGSCSSMVVVKATQQHAIGGNSYDETWTNLNQICNDYGFQAPTISDPAAISLWSYNANSSFNYTSNKWNSIAPWMEGTLPQGFEGGRIWISAGEPGLLSDAVYPYINIGESFLSNPYDIQYTSYHPYFSASSPGNYISSGLVEPGEFVMCSLSNAGNTIYGCTDLNAANYSAAATHDDGSCSYLEVYGCTDSAANNYNPGATVNDGTCDIAPVYGCVESNANNFNPEANTDDGSCIYDLSGCMDPMASNYNESANFDDGTCSYD